MLVFDLFFSLPADPRKDCIPEKNMQPNRLTTMALPHFFVNDIVCIKDPRKKIDDKTI